LKDGCIASYIKSDSRSGSVAVPLDLLFCDVFVNPLEYTLLALETRFYICFEIGYTYIENVLLVTLGRGLRLMFH
jgi:hypothetical protein